MINQVLALSNQMQARFQILFGRNLLKTVSSMKLSAYYFANGVYADMWQAHIGEKAVALKVWRCVSLSVQSRRSLEMVSVAPPSIRTVLPC
jgi:hypothetical protein